VSAKILVVDDEKNIVDILKFYFAKEGFSTLEANDGEQAIELALSEKPDLILLDIMLPKLDGFTVCRKLRESISTPIIMITAKEEEVDKVLGLELGADDYITKPFSTRELMARVKANLRRVASSAETQKKQSNYLKFGDLEIDIEHYEVRRNNEVIELTLREFELVNSWHCSRARYFKETLLEKVWVMNITATSVRWM